MDDKNVLDDRLNKKNDNFKYQRYFLLFCGISLTEREISPWFKWYTYYTFAQRAIWIILLITEVFYQLHSLEKIMRPIIFTCGLSMETTKLLALYLNRVGLEKAMTALQTGIFAPDINRGGAVEEKWIKECVDFGRKQAMAGGISGMITVTTICAGCLVRKMIYSDDNTKWELPFGESSVLYAKASPNYEFVLFLETISFYYAALTYISTDLYISNILANIATQFQILNNSIKRFAIRSAQKMKEDSGEIGNITEDEIDPAEVPWKYLKHTLKEIVDYHTSLIDISNYLEGVFNLAELSEHLGTLIVLCCVMFDGTQFPATDPRFISDLFISGAVLLQVCAVGFYGTKVTTESESTSIACFEADFVGTDVRLQKGWAMIMQRSQKPIVFTAYKFAPLAVTTSFAMLKAAVSYFMVLRSTGEESK